MFELLKEPDLLKIKFKIKAIFFKIQNDCVRFNIFILEILKTWEL